MSYHDPVFGPGGSAYAIQPHREVRPESGLSVYEVYDMKACRILTPFWAIGEGDEEEEEKGRGRQGASSRTLGGVRRNCPDDAEHGSLAFLLHNTHI